MLNKNHTSRCLLAGVLVAASVAALTSSASASSPAADGQERHCVAFVEDSSDGELHTGPEECFGSQSAAEDYAQKRTQERAAERQQHQSGTGTVEQQSVTTSETTIGLHFTGQYYTGSSIRIVGTTCAGGVWYATAGWNNNIESSYHYCGSAPTTFHDYTSCSGDSRSIYSQAPSLYEMNNRTSCVRYG